MVVVSYSINETDFDRLPFLREADTVTLAHLVFKFKGFSNLRVYTLRFYQLYEHFRVETEGNGGNGL